MKGIILAGGTGSRLLPLTKVTNKHLLPVGKQPMILHCVDKLVQAQVENIMVVTGTEHMGDMITLLGSGDEHGCEFTYRVQDEADGIAGALRLCKNFVGDDSCIVILGDNIFEDSLGSHVRSYTGGCKLFLKEVPDPERYGVAILDRGDVIAIEEKPEDPKSNHAIVGIYIYDNNVFRIIDELIPSARGEYEITDVNNAYIDNNEVTHALLDGWWTDAGTHSSYFKANCLVRGKK
jgi:glucose-1-phosphate thymidylyltransferase